jgi:hypothetical protein
VTKKGREVTVHITFANVNLTGAAGNIRITGLPFTCGDHNGYGTAVINGLGAAVVNAKVVAGQGYVDIIDALTSVAAPVVAAAGKYLFVTVTYDASN